MQLDYLPPLRTGRVSDDCSLMLSTAAIFVPMLSDDLSISLLQRSRTAFFSLADVSLFVFLQSLRCGASRLILWNTLFTKNFIIQDMYMGYSCFRFFWHFFLPARFLPLFPISDFVCPVLATLIAFLVALLFTALAFVFSFLEPFADLLLRISLALDILPQLS